MEVEVRLLYQTTSWEYIQFLWLQNDGTVTFLADEGTNMLDAWLNTGMSAPLEMATQTVALTPVAGNPPGDASGPTEPPMLATGYDAGTGSISLSYFPACDATGHTIHYGPLASVSAYGWQESDCSLDSSGAGSFVPVPAVGDSLFWVIVGHNPTLEGSYGKSGAGLERPPFTASPCPQAQEVNALCE
jgi:hypothetical protein